MGAIKIKGETSGSTTIVAPATGSDVTMTLPGSSLDLGAELASKLPIAGGKILQIVRVTDTTQRSTTSTSYVDVTGMSVTISPSKNDSALLILALGLLSPFNGSSNVMKVQITDDSNNALSGAEAQVFGVGVSQTQYFPLAMIGRVTPGTTNAVTYKVRFLMAGTGSTARFLNDETTAQLYAIEVSA
jgi:hypothetical protein